MKKFLFFLVFSLIINLKISGQQQDVMCQVEINTSQLAINDPTVFDALKQSVYEFINNRKWTPDVFGNNERIELSILINLTKRVSNEEYEATIQVSSRRPIYGTSYNSTILTHLDRDFTFSYVQFNVLEFSENTFISNLTSVLAFYVYYIIGLDYDSFSKNGGTVFFQRAQTIVNYCQNTDAPGWKSFENQNNRSWMIENIMSPRFANLRLASYVYHREGLDAMQKDPEAGRGKIYEALELLKTVHQNVPNSINLRMFFNSKADELINIYSNAPREEQNKVINLLNEIDPANTIKYQKILDGGK